MDARAKAEMMAVVNRILAVSSMLVELRVVVGMEGDLMIKGTDRLKAARFSCLYTFFLAARGASTSRDALLEELVKALRPHTNLRAFSLSTRC
jgi:hypothetical protein